MKTYLLLMAGGVGNRVGADIPKQFIQVFGEPVISSLLLNIEALVMVGTVVMFVGLIVGIVIAFYAMKKYNGSIFG